MSILLRMMLSGLLIQQLPTMLSPQKGCSPHTKQTTFGVMKMGNSSYSKIVEIGDVCNKTNVSCTLILKDVRHVPDLRMNMLSTLAMDRVGYCNHLGNGR